MSTLEQWDNRHEGILEDWFSCIDGFRTVSGPCREPCKPPVAGSPYDCYIVLSVGKTSTSNFQMWLLHNLKFFFLRSFWLIRFHLLKHMPVDLCALEYSSHKWKKQDVVEPFDRRFRGDGPPHSKHFPVQPWTTNVFKKFLNRPAASSNSPSVTVSEDGIPNANERWCINPAWDTQYPRQQQMAFPPIVPQTYPNKAQQQSRATGSVFLLAALLQVELWDDSVWAHWGIFRH